MYYAAAQKDHHVKIALKTMKSIFACIMRHNTLAKNRAFRFTFFSSVFSLLDLIPNIMSNIKPIVAFVLLVCKTVCITKLYKIWCFK